MVVYDFNFKHVNDEIVTDFSFFLDPLVNKNYDLTLLKFLCDNQFHLGIFFVNNFIL